MRNITQLNSKFNAHKGAINFKTTISNLLPTKNVAMSLGLGWKKFKNDNFNHSKSRLCHVLSPCFFICATIRRT